VSCLDICGGNDILYSVSSYKPPCTLLGMCRDVLAAEAFCLNETGSGRQEANLPGVGCCGGLVQPAQVDVLSSGVTLSCVTLGGQACCCMLGVHNVQGV